MGRTPESHSDVVVQVEAEDLEDTVKYVLKAGADCGPAGAFAKNVVVVE